MFVLPLASLAIPLGWLVPASPVVSPAASPLSNQEALDAAYVEYAYDRVPEALGVVADHVRTEVSRLQGLELGAAAQLAAELEVALLVFERMAQDLANDGLRLQLLQDLEVGPEFGALYGRLAWLSDAELTRLHPLLDWQMVGPFDNERGRGMVRATPPEADLTKDGYPGKVRDVSWRGMPKRQPKGGVISLGTLMDPATQMCAVVRTFVLSEEARTVHLALGASEEVSVWLNGEPLFMAVGEHAFGFDAHTVVLELQEGWNELALKVGSHEYRPQFQARLVDPETGAPIVLTTQPQTPEGFESQGLTDPGRRVKEPKVAQRSGAWRQFEGIEGAEAAFAMALIEAQAQAAPRSTRPGQASAQKALELDPTNLRYRILAVQTLRERGASAIEEDVNPYLATIDAGIEQHGDLPWFMRRRADFSMGLQQSPKMALPWIERALASAPDSFLVRRSHARILNALGLSQRATALHRALASEPESAVWAGLATDYAYVLPTGSEAHRAWIAAGVEAGSLRMVQEEHAERRVRELSTGPESWLSEYQDVLRYSPWSRGGAQSIADNLHAAGWNEQALALLEDVEELCPELPSLHSRRARFLWAMGQKEAAIQSLETAVELEFGNENLRRLLEYWKSDTTAAFHEEYREGLDQILSQRAQDEPLGDDEGGLEVLLRRVVTKVNPNGTAQAYHREVHRVLTEEGARQMDRRGFRGYPGEEDVRILHASVRRADGTRLDAETGRADRRGVVMVDYPPLLVGDVIDLEWRRDTLRTGVFGNYFGMKESFTPSDQLHVRTSEVVLLVPESFPLHLHERNFDGESKREELPDGTTRLTWKVEGLTPPRREAGMPPMIERVPQVHASSFSSWEEFGRWWWSLIEEELKPSPEMTAKALELTEGLGTPLDKLRAIYNFVVTDIRYNAWEFGVHGYEPYSASVIFSRGFGDCKDKAILMKVMLEQVGIEAWPVLIRMEDRRYEEDQTLALVEHFNHCIAYIPEQEGIGEMFLDGTARFHQLETLPDSDAGARVLIVRGDGVENRRIRFPEAQENHQRNAIRIDLTVDGPPQVSVQRQVQGRYDVRDRYRYSGSDEQKMEQAERFLSGLFGSVEGTPVVQFGDTEDLNQPMESSFEAVVESVARPTQRGMELPTTFEPLELLRGLASESQRSTDLLLDVPWSRETVIDYVLGEGAAPVTLPAPIQMESGDAAYTRTVEATPDGVRVTETFAVKTHRLGKDTYAEFREMCRAVDSAQADSIEVEVKQ